MSEWDPEQYEQFKEQRSTPFWDVVALVRPEDIRSLVDLGCGTGELTASVAARLGVERAIGIDSSSSMLARAEQFAGGGVGFESGDISRWTGHADHDLVLANASLQWVPDHAAVLERWSAGLRHGGQLAIQVPANSDHPSHLASVEVSRREPFLSAFGGSPPPDPVAANVLRPEEYATLLDDLGFVEQHVRLQVYPQRMASTQSVVEWTKGTSLTRFFARLPPEMHAPFVDAYRAELFDRIGHDGPYFYAFKRILMWGRLGL